MVHESHHNFEEFGLGRDLEAPVVALMAWDLGSHTSYCTLIYANTHSLNILTFIFDLTYIISKKLPLEGS